MAILAQAGLDSAVSGIVGIYVLVWLAGVILPPLFLFAWYLPEIIQLVIDTWQRRDFLAEAQFEREMEGRMINPDWRFGMSGDHIDRLFPQPNRRV